MQQALQKIASISSGGKVGAHDLLWHEWRHEHTQALRAHLASLLAPATVNKYLSALRGVLEACFDLGLLGAEEYQRAVKVKRVAGHGLPAGRSLDAAEIRELFAVCADGGPGGVRDAALIAVLYGCGLRRSEAIHVDLADLTPATGELRVRRGKGRKDRVVWVSSGAMAALGPWLELRGGKPGPLFLPVDKAGAITVRR